MCLRAVCQWQKYILTVTSIYKVRPNDHLLREAEDSQPPALQREVVYVPGVGDQLVVLIDLEADETDLRPMQQTPAVGGLLAPAHVTGIFPQECHLKSFM